LIVVFFFYSGFSTLITYKQLLLVQDGKLYGRDSMFAVITRVAALPEVTKNHDIQNNEYIGQLGQVKTISSFGIAMYALAVYSSHFSEFNLTLPSYLAVLFVGLGPE
jgi:hypothetical protein